MKRDFRNIIGFFYCLILFAIFNISMVQLSNKDIKNIDEGIYEKCIVYDTIVVYDTILVNTYLKNITLTVYNPVKAQCNDNPLITANGTKIDLEKLKNGEIKYCAISRDLLREIPYGSNIYIEGHGEYKVVDTMNKRFKNRVDILQDVSQKGFKKDNIKIIKME